MGPDLLVKAWSSQKKFGFVFFLNSISNVATVQCIYIYETTASFEMDRDVEDTIDFAYKELGEAENPSMSERSKRSADESELQTRVDPTKKLKTNEFKNQALPTSTSANELNHQEPTNEFEYREYELQQYVDLLVHNWSIKDPILQNYGKMQLAVASQMVGSGKTWFGANILSSAKRNKEKSLLSIPVADRSKFEEFLESKYIYMDLRSVAPFNEETFLQSLCRAIIKNVPELADYETVLKKERTARLLVDRCCMLVKLTFFFHFDEIDVVAAKVAISQNKPDANYLGAYYSFWFMVASLLPDSYIYCSGRSPLLYLLSKSPLVMISPSTVKHFFFDRLLCNNIENMVQRLIQRQKLNLKDVTIQNFARFVCMVTAGVPRFVMWTLDFFQQQNGAPVAKQDLKAADLFTKLCKYIKKNGGEYELKSTVLTSNDTTQEEKDLYIKFANDAILGIPHKLEAVQTVVMEGKEFKVTVLQLLWALGFYTAKTPQFQLEGKQEESHCQSDANIDDEDANVYPIVPPIIAYDMPTASDTPAVMFQIIDIMLYTIQRNL